MKITYCSDLHCEFINGSADLYSKFTNAENSDVLVIAGDISTTEYGVDELFSIVSKNYSITLYVLGNHDYWGRDLKDTKFMYQNPFDNVKILDKTYIDIDGVRFYGGTMWTDYNNQNPLVMLQCRSYMKDFDVMTCHNARIDIEDFIYENRLFRERLEESFTGFSGKKVVISHHCPVVDYCDSEPICYAYGNTKVDMEGIDHWIFGHTHSRIDGDVINNCRIYSNARGYFGYESMAYSFEQRTIEI